MLYTDIHDFKKSVGGGANVSLEMDSINATIEDTLRLHIEPWLGEQLTEDLLAAYEAGALDANQTALLPYIQAPLAKLTMYEYSRIGAIQFSESGMHRVETDNVRSAYKYQEAEYANSMLTHGYEALERLLKFLTKNSVNYTAWDTSDAKARHNGYFVRYASEFRMHYSKSLGRYTYECLRPVIEDVECGVEQTMAQGLWDDLKSKYVAGTATTNEKKAIFLLQRAIVNYAVMEGLHRHWVQVEGNRVVHRTDKDADRHAQRTQADITAHSMAHRHHEMMANRYVRKFMCFIVENEADFPLAFCADGFWDEATVTQNWTDANGKAWAYATDSTGTRCYLTAEQLEEMEDSDECCPERETGCGDGFSTSSCGCGGGCGCGCDGGHSHGGGKLLRM